MALQTDAPECVGDPTELGLPSARSSAYSDNMHRYDDCAVTAAHTESSHDSEGVAPERAAEALRRARLHRGWTLRDVERLTSRPNAYLSQVERGVIKQPDPAVIWQLADLYNLNFDLLMEWSGRTSSSEPSDDPTVSAIIRRMVALDERQRQRVMAFLATLDRD